MTSQTAFHRFFPLAFLPLCFCFAGSPAAADTSHARIIRLSHVQGDVRIAHNVSGDPLQSTEGAWERASLNLPIHQGDALATDNGRAEVEFESGTSIYLAENTVLEFYDLSLDDGSFTTRLILRQGSASFSVRSSRGDYFSVTGGDFSVEANEKSYFRVNNYDDGSDVQVFRGHLSVLSKDKSTPVGKGRVYPCALRIPIPYPWKAHQIQTNSISGFPGELNPETRPSMARANTPAFTITPPVSVISIPTADGIPLTASVIAGGRMAFRSVGIRSRWVSGISTQRSEAGDSSAVNLGAGCPITTAVGFSIPAWVGSGRQLAPFPAAVPLLTRGTAVGSQ